MIVLRLIASAMLVLLLFFSAFAQEARKIDEFSKITCGYLRNRLDSFFSELYKAKDAKGYIFVYEGRLLMPPFNEENKTIYPQRGEAKVEIELFRKHIKFRDFDKSKIVFIKGGFREIFTVEFWIVPNNSTPPKTTPTLKNMRYRKGKATKPCI